MSSSFSTASKERRSTPSSGDRQAKSSEAPAGSEASGKGQPRVAKGPTGSYTAQV